MIKFIRVKVKNMDLKVSVSLKLIILKRLSSNMNYVNLLGFIKVFKGYLVKYGRIQR